MGSDIECLDTRAWALSAGVHAVAIGEDVILLDENADSYTLLPQGAPQLRGLASGAFTIPDDRLALDLEGVGLIRRRGRAPSCAVEIASALPTKSLEPAKFHHIGVRAGYRALQAGVDVASNYRGKPLATLLDRARHARGLRKSLVPDVIALVHDFHRWAPFAPLPGKCLVRSFVLLGVLQRWGFTADWVFGVRTWPFAAHCWLQIDDVVLDDHHDRLVAFHPILIV